MNRRQLCTGIVSFFALVVLVAAVNAQSKDRDNPTRLTSNEISGVIDSDSKGNIYYYSFMAGPGELSITLTVEPGRQLRSSGLGLKSVIFTLFDRNAETLDSKEAATYDGGDPKQVVARIEITRRQLVVLSIKIPGGSFFEGSGKYRVRINGAVEFGENSSTTVSRDKSDSSGCLPKQGTLIIKMKDGSKKIIDLSEAETITVVP